VYGGGRPLVPLPATRDEATRIGADVTLLGADASEAGLRAALARAPTGRWRAVHLACHGLIDGARPLLSALALSPDAENDGYLTPLELLDLDIPADLAVLSACETARGREYRADGILGLSRAFMYAGAPRVICSLWKVDDRATSALMTKFYERWRAGSSAADALREAQEHVRSQETWAHPYYWAAWVLWGLGD
jgi:CHAT domain-containing protein